MKANELRIGNYVNIEGDVVKVKEIYEKGIHYANGEYESYATEDFIQPIKLTEELLLNIGFEKIELVEKKLYMYYKEVRINNYSYLLDFRVMPKDECIVLYVMKKEDDELDYSTIFYNDNIKYLHQLQNAYYLLTNKELNIEL